MRIRILIKLKVAIYISSLFSAGVKFVSPNSREDASSPLQRAIYRILNIKYQYFLVQFGPIHSRLNLNSYSDGSGFKKLNLKVVTNEKGEAVGDVLTIIC
jgi:hypothetical protein